MHICLIETNVYRHFLESLGSLQMLNHPILMFPGLGVGGPLRKTKRKEAGQSVGGRKRRRGQFSCSV